MIDARFFKKNPPLSLKQIGDILAISVPEEAKDQLFSDIAPLNEASASDITCFHNSKYREALKKTQAGLCLISQEAAHHLPNTTLPLIVSHPYRCFGKLAGLLYPRHRNSSQIKSLSHIHPSAQIGKDCFISPSALIEENVVIGDGSFIGPYCVIQHGTILGQDCHLEAHVTLGYSLIGDRLFVKPGARIGQPGFGFHMDHMGHFDIPQLGRVLIGHDVHIGANTTIDRGSFSDTKIGDGVRIDNLVQIAHNVEIGNNSVLVAQVGIAGSSKLGKFVIAAGQVGIAGHLNIGHGVKIAAQSGLMRDVADGETVAGSPAVPVREWHKQTIALQKLLKTSK